MGAFGDRLRREREMRGVSLDEIATATKIGTRSLKALEEEDFSKLPGGIFNKGFVRAYAKFLGMNEDQAVADYVSAAGEAEQNSEAVMERLAAESERREDERRIARAREKNAGPPFTWNTIAIVVVLAVAAVLGWQYYSKRKALRAQQPAPSAVMATESQKSQPAESPSVEATHPAGVVATATTPATPPEPAKQVTPAATAPTPSPQSTPAAQAAIVKNVPAPVKVDPPQVPSPSPVDGASGLAQEFVVVVKATKPAWLASSADNQRESQRTLGPNAQAIFRAKSNLTLTIGNAGGVEISFNGRTLPPVGEENQKKTLIFTPEGPQ